LIASSLARIRFLIVLRPMTNEPHLRDRVQKCVKAWLIPPAVLMIEGQFYHQSSQAPERCR
jgi:hypothetical protein